MNVARLVNWAAVVVVAVPVGMALLVVGLLALCGGLRLRSPIDEMQAEIDRFELTPDDRLTGRDRVEDAVCFLECSDWRVGVDFDRESPGSFEVECEQLSVRFAEWAASPVKRIESIVGPDPSRCVFEALPPAFGHDNWTVLAGAHERVVDGQRTVEWSVGIIVP